MVKYCPNCGKEHYEDDLFCKECNEPVPEKPQINVVSPVNNEPIGEQSYKSYDIGKPPRKSKLLIVIGVLVITAILISVSFFVLFYSNGKNSEDITKYYLRNDGPKINLQSSLTGSIYPSIEEGYFATYGYYYNGEKIGTANLEDAGEETVQGVVCSKIKTSGYMDMVADNSPIKCTFESYDYRMLEGSAPYYMTMDFVYSKPSSFTMSSNYRWDRQNSRMDYTVSMSGTNTDFECILPEDYWNLIGSTSFLQVGFSKELKYTMSTASIGSVEVTMRVRVLEQEDVIVQNGEYNDCYKVEVYQTYEVLGTNLSQTFIFWMNDQGVMPQAETTSNSGGTITTILMKLDEYYTKTPT